MPERTTKPSGWCANNIANIHKPRTQPIPMNASSLAKLSPTPKQAAVAEETPMVNSLKKVANSAQIPQPHTQFCFACCSIVCLACVQDETMICTDFELCKKTPGCTRKCEIGKKHVGVCSRDGKALKADKMDTPRVQGGAEAAELLRALCLVGVRVSSSMSLFSFAILDFLGFFAIFDFRSKSHVSHPDHLLLLLIFIGAGASAQEQKTNCVMQQVHAPWQSLQANRFSSSIPSFYKNISAQPPRGLGLLVSQHVGEKSYAICPFKLGVLRVFAVGCANDEVARARDDPPTVMLPICAPQIAAVVKFEKICLFRAPLPFANKKALLVRPRSGKNEPFLCNSSAVGLLHCEQLRTCCMPRWSHHHSGADIRRETGAFMTNSAV